jgi:hypothetical protein
MTDSTSASEAALEAMAAEIRRRMATPPGEHLGMEEVFERLRAQLAERRRRAE